MFAPNLVFSAASSTIIEVTLRNLFTWTRSPIRWMTSVRACVCHWLGQMACRFHRLTPILCRCIESKNQTTNSSVWLSRHQSTNVVLTFWPHSKCNFNHLYTFISFPTRVWSILSIRNVAWMNQAYKNKIQYQRRSKKVQGETEKNSVRKKMNNN